MTTSTTTYTRPDGSPYDERENEIIDRTRHALLTGRAFANAASSARSAIGYRPPLRRDQWAHAMATLARMASQSDAFAQIAARVFGHVNLYGTAPEATAQVYEAALAVLAVGYDDVIGRNGPGAGRPSSYHRDFTIAERVLLKYWLAEATAPMASHVPGVGWCVSAIARAEHIVVHHHHFPSLHEFKARARQEAETASSG